MKSKQIVFYLFVITIISSCVKKSTYQNVLNDLENCEQTRSNLDQEISNKNRQIRELKSELQDSRIQASSDLQSNSEMGKNRLKSVESSIEDIIRKVSYCEDQNDLDRIKSDLSSVQNDLHTFIFFNY